MSPNIKGRNRNFMESIVADTDMDLAESSKSRYDELVERLFSIATEKTPQALVDAFESKLNDQKNILAPSSAFSYSAAVKYWLRKKAKANYERGLEFEVYEVAHTRVENLDIPRLTQKPEEQVTKSFNEQILLKLIGTNKSQLRTLTLFLKANLMVGLRPVEWADVSFFSEYDPQRAKKTGQLGLSIKNAKVSKERGNGEFREIILHNIRADQLSVLREYREVVYAFIENNPDVIIRDGLYYSFYKNLQQQLKNFQKKHGFEGGESLYSTRHQCVANAKKRGLSRVEVAAMFGHKSPATAEAHYGRKSDGKGGVGFLPSVMSMEAVKTYSPETINIFEQSQEWILQKDPDAPNHTKPNNNRS